MGGYARAGDSIRESAAYPDAVAVAHETMRRARANIELLVPRLRALDYRFTHSNEIYVPPLADASSEVDAMEKIVGVFPLALRAWYEIVGTVYFRGEHPQLGKWLYVKERQVTLFPDPLELFLSPEYVAEEYEAYQYAQKEEGLEGAFPLYISGDDYAKGDTSGGVPYAIALPNGAVDAPVVNLLWREATFVEWMRLTFQWGGFPGFSRYPNYPKEEIAFLTEGLLPL